MEEEGPEALEAALREGIISEDQYEALKARLARERTRETTGLAARRLLWTGLVLVASLVIYVTTVFLDYQQRIAILGVGLGITFGLALWLWRQPGRFTLSRGLLGLAIFQFAILLLLLQAFQSIPGSALLVALTIVTILGASLGIRENSTWLATPSVVSFYIGFLGGPGGALVSFDTLLETTLIVSLVIAVLVAVLLWAWRRGQLRSAHAWYLRREAALGQLGRGHFVLFTVFVFLVLVVLAPSGRRFFFDQAPVTASLIPFGIALAGLLYAWRTENTQLLAVASFLILLLTRLLVPFSGVTLWPIAVSVTAALLIYLGLRIRGQTA
ncbi:MAG: hypothetical protein ACE5LS_06270 [Thermoplasmata archaeon]